MFEVLQEAIRPVNLPYTILFGLCGLYWLTYIAGAIGADLLDFDLGDGDVDADSSGCLGLGAVMRFVYAADVPVTLVVSVLSISMWCLSILTNYYTGNASLLLAAAFFVPIFLAGLVLTKFSLMPFVPLLKKLFDETGDSVQVIGQLCVVTSLEATPKRGQAELPMKGAPLLLNVKTREGVTMRKGDEAVVVAREEDGTYIIAPFEENVNKTEPDAV